MDDILILAKTRWKLKKAIKVLNQTFDELKLEKHPDKTFIGRVEKGFDFLGYHISPEGLSLAKKTVENFISRAIRLYEQEPGEDFASSRLGLYVQRWFRWVVAGLLPCGGLIITVFKLLRRQTQDFRAHDGQLLPIAELVINSDVTLIKFTWCDLVAS
jgi:hypothetical protein